MLLRYLMYAARTKFKAPDGISLLWPGTFSRIGYGSGLYFSLVVTRNCWEVTEVINKGVVNKAAMNQGISRILYRFVTLPKRCLFSDDLFFLCWHQRVHVRLPSKWGNVVYCFWQPTKTTSHNITPELRPSLSETHGESYLYAFTKATSTKRR